MQTPEYPPDISIPLEDAANKLKLPPEKLAARILRAWLAQGHHNINERLIEMETVTTDQVPLARKFNALTTQTAGLLEKATLVLQNHRSLLIRQKEKITTKNT